MGGEGGMGGVKGEKFEWEGRGRRVETTKVPEAVSVLLKIFFSSH